MNPLEVYHILLQGIPVINSATRHNLARLAIKTFSSYPNSSQKSDFNASFNDASLGVLSQLLGHDTDSGLTYIQCC